MSLASRLSDADAHPFTKIDPIRVELGPKGQWSGADSSDMEFHRTRWPEILREYHRKIVADLGIVSCERSTHYDSNSRFFVIVKTETETAIFSWEDEENGSWK